LKASYSEVDGAASGPWSRLVLALAAWRVWLPPLLAAGVALFASLHYVRSLGILTPVFDDSFISLEFARNLAEHGKLSFDGHTWSTGATSLLHVGSSPP
jgi:hypothetical protein